MKRSESFRYNFLVLKVFGVWPGRNPSKQYIYFASIFLFIMFVLFYFALTLNLLYTPRTIEFLIPEVIFYFNETAVLAKLLMIIFKCKEIISIMDMLDDEEFQGDQNGGYKIVNDYNTRYVLLWKSYALFSFGSYSAHVFPPIPLHFFFGSSIDFPVCKYYFLSSDTRKINFWLIYMYQTVGIGIHMMYNVNLDTLVSGVIYMAVAQIKTLNLKLMQFKMAPDDEEQSVAEQEKIQIQKLNQCLKHYDLILKYCDTVQDIINRPMFIQFGMASAIICAVLSGLLSPSSSGTNVSMVTYLIAMCGQIFVPCYFGNQLTYVSSEIAFAAYSTEWIPHSEPFKRSLKVFVERANQHIVLTGVQLFPLSLETFTSIMKSAYSFFTLIRSFTEEA